MDEVRLQLLEVQDNSQSQPGPTRMLDKSWEEEERREQKEIEIKNMRKGHCRYAILCFVVRLLLLIPVAVVGVWGLAQSLRYFPITMDASFIAIPVCYMTIALQLSIVPFLTYVVCGLSAESQLRRGKEISLSLCISPTISYVILNLFLVVLVLIGGIAAFIISADLERRIEINANSTFQFYLNDSIVQENWNLAQKTLDCCGVFGFSDYEDIFNNLSVPISCCNTSSPLANIKTCPVVVANALVANQTDLHNIMFIKSKGCAHQLKMFYYHILTVLGAVSIPFFIYYLCYTVGHCVFLCLAACFTALMELLKCCIEFLSCTCLEGQYEKVDNHTMACNSELEEAFECGDKIKATDLLSTVQCATAIRISQLNFTHGERVSLLHCAAYYGWTDVAHDLIINHKCSVNQKDSVGRTALHFAAAGGHLEVVKYLVAKHRCQPNHTTRYGLTPLHYACTNGRLNIAKYLISELNCDPAPKTIFLWDTPLHNACEYGHADIVQFLLSISQVDPEVENNNGNTPLYYAQKGSNSFKVFKTFKQCGHAVKDFKIHTFSKVILTGNSQVGKSSLAQVVIHRANRNLSDIFQDKVFGHTVIAEELTAGINPLQIESEEAGNMVLYDIAGQAEFHSSHLAVMENMVGRSSAIFINLVDLRQSEVELKRSLYYWIDFIENASCKARKGLPLVVVGSHADLVNRRELQRKTMVLHNFAKKRVKQHCLMGVVTMDCRKVESRGVREFIFLLSQSQRNIISQTPMMSFQCHYLYAFLQAKKVSGNVVAITLQNLCNTFASEGDDSIISSDLPTMTRYVEQLTNTGLVMLIRSKEQVEKSWVLVGGEVLLKEVNGTLFSPKGFKEHQEIASNTGIIPYSSLVEKFHQHNPDMLLGFLESLDFCCSVDLGSMTTNLSPLQSHNLSSEMGSYPLLFFPSLVQVERPGIGHQFSFGWCIGFQDDDLYFTPRFLHVLLLSIIYAYSPMKCKNISICGLTQDWKVWKNGISWSDDDGITTVVELFDQNRWVVVAMSCSENRQMEYARLRSGITSMIRSLQREHSPMDEPKECIMSPSLVKQYPISSIPESEIFAIDRVARSVLLKKPYVHGDRGLRVDELPVDAYSSLSHLSVCQLLDSSISDSKPVPYSLVDDIHNQWPQIQMEFTDFHSVRKYMSRLSIFSRKNILETAGLTIEDILQEADVSLPALRTDNITAMLKKHKFRVVKWSELAVCLRQSSHVERIDADGRNSNDKFIRLIDEWVANDTRKSWFKLVDALYMCGEKVTAVKLARELGIPSPGK